MGAALGLLGLALLLWLLFGEPPPRQVEVEPAGEVERVEPVPQPAPPPAADAPEPPPAAVGPFQRQIAVRLAQREAPSERIAGGLRVSAREVAWDDTEGRPFLRAVAIEATLRFGPDVEGALAIEAMTLRSPVVNLIREPGDELWNYERVLAGVLDDGTDGRPRDGGARVTVSDARVIDGRVTVRTPGSPEPYRFRDVDALVARAIFGEPGAPGPRFQVARLTTVVTAPELDEPLAADLSDAPLQVRDDDVAFRFARLLLDDARLVDGAGEWEPGAPGFGLLLDSRVASTPLTDLRRFVPELPSEGTATFDLGVAPLPGGRTSIAIRNLVGRSGESRVRGTLDVLTGLPDGSRVTGLDLELESVRIALLERFIGPLPYAGTVTGPVSGSEDALRFDLFAQLTVPEVEGPTTAQVAGLAVAGPDGYELQELTADLEQFPLAALAPLAPGLPGEGFVTGRVALEGPPGRAPLSVDVRLTLAGGTASVTGTLDLTGAVPAYDLSGRLVGVQLPLLLQPDVPPVALTARFSVTGTGTRLRAMDSRLSLVGRFTGWRSGPGDGIRLQAAVDDGRLALDTAAVALASLSLRASGNWRFVSPGAGRIAYELRIGDLEPFGPYLPYLRDSPSGGALATQGELSGTLDRPRFAGRASGESLRYGAWAAEELEAEYRVRPPLPEELELVVTAAGVETPTEVAFRTARLEAEADGERFDIAFEGERSDQPGTAELVADGVLADNGARVAVFRRLRYEMDGSEWTLVRPARVRWGVDGAVLVEDFTVEQVDGEGRIAVDGRLPPSPARTLDVTVAALPVGDFVALAGRETVITGLLWADASIAGTAESPLLDVEFRFADAAVRDVGLDVLEGTVMFRAGQLAGELTAVVDTTVAGGELDATASVPAELTLEGLPELDVAERGPLDGLVTADRFPLRVLGPLTPDFEDPEGVLNGRVRVAGTMSEPVFDGELAVLDGAVTVVPLEQRYGEIHADLVLERQRVVIRELRARSDGWAYATGEVRFVEAMRPEANLRLRFEGFRPVGVENQDDAALDGELRLAGPLSSPVVTGAVVVDDGAVPIPGLDGPELLEDGFDELALPADTVGAAADQGGWIENVSLDGVRVEAGDDLWFVSEEAQLRLGGELTLYRTAGEFTIFGTLTGDEGEFTIVAGPFVRRFEIVSAEVRFLGTAGVDPIVDITASRTVFGPDGEPINILVTIEGTLDSPELALATPGDAPVPQSELLSFVLFGQPSFALEEGGVPGQQVLEEVVVGGLFDVALLELEEELVGDLGLPFQFVRIRTVPGDIPGLGAPMVVIGTEITDDVFLTIDTGVSTLFGATGPAATWGAALRWRIDPEWTLDVGLEPVRPTWLLPGAVVLTPVLTTDQRQLTIDLRRRWTY